MFDRTIFDTTSVDIPLLGSNRGSTQIMVDRRAAELFAIWTPADFERKPDIESAYIQSNESNHMNA